MSLLGYIVFIDPLSLVKLRERVMTSCIREDVINIKWDYNYHQPWSDNEWLVDEMLALLEIRT